MARNSGLMDLVTNELVVKTCAKNQPDKAAYLYVDIPVSPQRMSE